jgi:hypothetical protein
MDGRIWIRLLALVVSFFGLCAFADLPPYELVLLENPNFRDHTCESTVDRLRLTKSALDSYACDGKQEFQFIPELFVSNAAGDSLRIKASKSAEFVIYRSANQIENTSDPFIKDALKVLSTLESLPSGRLLIDRLRHSPFPLTITLGTPHFWPSDDAGNAHKGLMMAQALQHLVTLRWEDINQQFDHVGAGGPISFNPNLGSVLIEADGQKREAPPYTVLAHEMYHAFDGIRGLLDRRILSGDGYEFTEVTEYRASYFENRIRFESGLRYRKYYGAESGDRSLLDANGNPLFIPATCLKAAYCKSRKRHF